MQTWLVIIGYIIFWNLTRNPWKQTRRHVRVWLEIPMRTGWQFAEQKKKKIPKIISENDNYNKRARGQYRGTVRNVCTKQYYTTHWSGYDTIRYYLRRYLHRSEKRTRIIYARASFPDESRFPRNIDDHWNFGRL